MSNVYQPKRKELAKIKVIAGWFSNLLYPDESEEFETILKTSKKYG